MNRCKTFIHGTFSKDIMAKAMYTTEYGFTTMFLSSHFLYKLTSD